MTETVTCSCTATYVLSMAWVDGAPRSARRAVTRAVEDAARRAIDRRGAFRVPRGSVTFLASRPRR